MGLEVVSHDPRIIVVPVSPNGTSGETVYVGQPVYKGLGGVLPKGAASGASDTTNKLNQIFGVVVGICEIGSEQSYSSSYSANYISTPANISHAHLAARSEKVQRHAHGMWKMGDTDYKVEVALVTPETVLRAPIFNSSWGTAPTVATVSTGSTTGLGCTTDAIDFTPVAQMATVQFRSGANNGVARILDSTSTTVHTWDIPCKEDIAVGDTLVAVNLPAFGLARMQLDSEGMFVDNSAALTSDYYTVNVLRLYLDDAGSEKVEFMFTAENWAPLRA